MGTIAVMKEPKIVLIIKAATLPNFYGAIWKGKGGLPDHSRPTHTGWGRPVNQFPLVGVGGSISRQPSTVLEAGAGVPATTSLTQDEGPVNDPFYEEERTPEGERLTPEQTRADKGSYDPDDPARKPDTKPEKRIGVSTLESFEGPKMTKLRTRIKEAQSKHSNAQSDSQKTLNGMMEAIERAKFEGRLQVDRVTGKTFLLTNQGRKPIHRESGLTEDMNRKLSIKRNTESTLQYKLRQLRKKLKKEMLEIGQGLA